MTTFQHFTLKKTPVELQDCLNPYSKQCQWCIYVYMSVSIYLSIYQDDDKEDDK